MTAYWKKLNKYVIDIRKTGDQNISISGMYKKILKWTGIGKIWKTMYTVLSLETFTSNISDL